MMPSTFEACDAYAMRDDNTSNDSAPGETWTTRWAVIEATWAHAAAQGVVPNKPLSEATEAECETVRHVEFWNALHCGQFPPGVNYMVYSNALLSGTGYIARTVQRIVGVPQDGVIGKDTLRAVNSYGDKALMDAIWAANAQHFVEVDKPQFTHGWTIRNDQDIAEAYLMASVQASPPKSGPVPASGFPNVTTDDAATDALNAEEQRILQGTTT